MANATSEGDGGRHHQRKRTGPMSHASRRKPRRWPLILRFIKGSIHGAVVVPVTFHALFTAAVVYIDRNYDLHLGLPASIIPSLSIVVGLMLVFRNQTSYNRFWEGRNHLTTVITSVRNLTRSFISCSHKISDPEPASLSTDRADTERTVRILIAILYATKNHLRSDWGFATIPATEYSISNGFASARPEYSDMLPHLTSFEDRGLGLPLQLTCFVEQYIKRGEEREWFHAPQASQMQVQLNNLVDAYGKMETIRLTPIPIAHLIHQKQVLALFGCVLAFAMVDEMGWWAVPLVAFVIFTLYGIEGIGGQLEDPFGYDKNDIKMDAIVEDIRVEVTEELEEWKRVGRQGGEMFIGKGNAVGRDFAPRVVNFRVEADEVGAGV